MDEWRKVTWSDYQTMPGQGQLVECHRMYSNGQGGWFCWRMIGTGVVHVPLMTGLGHDLLSSTHPLQYQVSVRPSSAAECTDHPSGVEPDRYGNLILDTLYWREIEPTKEQPL